MWGHLSRSSHACRESWLGGIRSCWSPTRSGEGSPSARAYGRIKLRLNASNVLIRMLDRMSRVRAVNSSTAAFVCARMRARRPVARLGTISRAYVQASCVLPHPAGASTRTNGADDVRDASTLTDASSNNRELCLNLFGDADLDQSARECGSVIKGLKPVMSI